ncbi:ADAM metallopeptidase with thrombospondin type 1 motif A isoform X1 [Dermacentor variabilis]|uniref:ADAM metallopeptidase with thrombospondin type 1 motif A isoform X1 n=2 Tax=Dermacentor variabilis TaxID=34621 RepID=UPI003F5C36B8
MLSRPVGMSLTALLFVCFVACCCWPGPAAVAEQRLLSGSSLPRTRPVFPEPLDYPRPSVSRTRRHGLPATSRWQHAPSTFSSSSSATASTSSSQPSSSPSSSSSSSRPPTASSYTSSNRWRRFSWPSAGSSRRSRGGHRLRNEDGPVLWRVEPGLTLRLWRDSSHVSPRLLALRYRDAPGGQDARDLVPLQDGDAENEADGADDVRNCFYSGEVVGEPGSKAVVSLCHGMTGYIYSPSRGMFTVEPIGGGEDQDQRGAHVLRHHRGGQTATSNSTQDHTADEDGEPSNSWSGHHRQQQGSASHRRRRRKRSYSLEQHVEVLVAADSKMARYHGKNLKHYILTLMAAVAHIYKDHTIGNLLNIAVVKLLIMEEDEDNDIISPSASNTLKNFCRWQQQHNHPDDSHPYHHDTAILLTREDLCRLPKTCDTLGLAQSGMICDPHGSCAVVEDNGLSAAFTIAHELGHVLNIPHDDDQKCAKYRLASQPLHVMARMLDYNSHPWSWSACSRHYVTNFLDAGYGQCLRDSPGEDLLGAPHSPSSKQAGEWFNMDEQCELVFGRGAKVCPYMPVCKRLWCTVHGHPHGGCRTQHMPWADGTSCGKNHWCQQGQCVARPPDAERRKKVDGEWGPWQEYERCSRTCGGGIQSTRRECNSPTPAFGGRYCTGQRVKYRSCNTQPCPLGSMDFREQQCSAFNGKTFNFPDVPYNPKWTAHHSGISHVDSCKLYCRVVDQSAYYLLKEKVIDGTACNPESFDVCINGVCKPAGCDHQLNSTATTDICGVCGGDNATCRTIKGHFNLAQFGYNFVTVIPAGASYVEIHQFGFEKDDNYLALKSAEDEFLLNGNYTVSMFRKTLRYGGTVIEYSGSNASIERINATKPLGKELHLMVLTVGKVESPDIRFQYTMSIRDERRYYWELSPHWSECSSDCQGHRHRRAECKRRPDSVVVDDTHCEPSTKPQTMAETCNLHCTLWWRVGEPSECSAQCGNGVRTRSVQCVQRSDGGQESVVPDSRCKAREPKPPEVEKCGEPCRNFRWDYGDWQPCSKTCGGGEQSRTAACVNENQERHPDSQCDLSARTVKRPCNQGDCPRWELGHWTECSVTCGSGHRQRPLWCHHGDRVVAPSFCHPTPRPQDKEPCEMPPCEAPARWHLGEQGPCSVTCGGGVTYRNVTCRSASGAIVDEAHCHGSPRPHEATECNRVSCPLPWNSSPTSADRPGGVTSAASEHPSTGPRSNFAAWKSAPWSQCSATCGSGVRKRQVSCINEVTGAVLPDKECVYEIRPSVAEACDAGTCGKWQHGDWSACSSKCGPGVSSRRVQCFVRDNLREVLPDSQCDEAMRPKQEQPCVGPCLGGGLPPTDATNHPSGNHVEGPYRWRFGQWGTCSRSCGGGTQRRQVVCVDNLESKSNACNELLRPPETQHCNTEECPTWSVSEWTPCDQECGGGQQTRRVACQGVIGFVDAHCPQPKPDVKRACNLHSCAAPTASYRWRPGPWSSCSVTCGSGVMKRSVECVDSSLQAAPYANCEGDPPEHIKDCTMRECPRWQLAPWSQCSAPCGNGTQKRVARCVRRGVEVNHLECHGKRPETQVRTCNLRTCHYRWKKKRWSPCPVTCGGGRQTRFVVCVDRNERQAPERFCASQRRPKVVRNCAAQPCPFVWRTSDWSECSRTCGEGFQKRSVTCHKVNAYGWVDPTPLTHSAAERLSALEAESSPFYQGSQERRGPHYCSSQEKPPNSRACMVGHCGEGVFWRPGPWTPCSTNCGQGKQKRRLRCYDQRNKRVNNSHCSSALKNRIKRKRRCFLRPCTPVSCAEVQRRGGVRVDGEQKLYVRGRVVSVYCARMNTSEPQEYLSLASGESNNYSEVYGKRLRNPDECPYGGARVDKCDCIDDYPASLTTFSKVSFNITTLRMNRRDFAFSRTLHGTPAGVGGAGDCYSRAQCAQGRFSLSLAGTDFTVSPVTEWVTQGSHTYHSIRRLQGGQIIQGRCGGYCGQCFPDEAVGLVLDVRPP